MDPMSLTTRRGRRQLWSGNYQTSFTALYSLLLESLDALPDPIVLGIIQLNPQRLHRRNGPGSLFLENAELRRGPATQKTDTRFIRRRMHVRWIGGQVPDDDLGWGQGSTGSMHILPCPLEGLPNHLQMRGPRLRLEVVTVGVAGELGDTVGGTGLVPVHIRQNQEKLGFLPWPNPSRLEILQNKVHGRLEIGTGALAYPTVNRRQTLKQIVGRERVPRRRGIKGHHAAAESRAAGLRSQNAEGHGDPVGSVTLSAGRLHGTAKVTHDDPVAETTAGHQVTEHGGPDCRELVALRGR